MSFWNWLVRKRDDRGWPAYIVNGRIRTSTAGLIVAFFAISWLNDTYQPPPAPVVPEAAQVVPPGFMPDPEYTWVPRTQVQEPRRTAVPTTTPTTTTTSPTEPTDTTDPSVTTSPTESATTFVDPDGPGPLPPAPLTSSSDNTTTSPTSPGQNPSTTTSAPPPVLPPR